LRIFSKLKLVTKKRKKKETAAGDTNSLTHSPVFFSKHTHTYIQQQQTSKLMTAEVLTVDEKDTSFL